MLVFISVVYRPLEGSNSDILSSLATSSETALVRSLGNVVGFGVIGELDFKGKQLQGLAIHRSGQESPRGKQHLAMTGAFHWSRGGLGYATVLQIKWIFLEWLSSLKSNVGYHLYRQHVLCISSRFNQEEARLVFFFVTWHYATLYTQILFPIVLSHWRIGETAWWSLLAV